LVVAAISKNKTAEKEVESKVSWIDASGGHKLGLEAGKIVCQNPKGKRLASVPPALKEDPITDQLQALCSWLDEHCLECLHTTERWMLRSLTIPQAIIMEVWPDADWRDVLVNTVICPCTENGKMNLEACGLLKDIDATKGLGIVDVDGESKWLRNEFVAIPHPILIQDLEDVRELAVDLGIQQKLEQLYRPTFAPRADQLDLKSVRDFESGVFDQLMFAMGACRKLGYPVRGGYATCKVWEGELPLEARYYIGSESPDSPTETGELIFVDSRQIAVPIRDVGRVTFSEGVRMASSIYAKRKVENKEENTQ